VGTAAGTGPGRINRRPGGAGMKFPQCLPKKWRTIILVLEDLQDQISIRVMHKIGRINRRMIATEERGRSA
jgi:hypothetical protein